MRRPKGVQMNCEISYSRQKLLSSPYIFPVLCEPYSKTNRFFAFLLISADDDPFENGGIWCLSSSVCDERIFQKLNFSCFSLNCFIFLIPFQWDAISILGKINLQQKFILPSSKKCNLNIWNIDILRYIDINGRKFCTFFKWLQQIESFFYCWVHHYQTGFPQRNLYKKEERAFRLQLNYGWYFLLTHRVFEDYEDFVYWTII